MLFSFLIPSMTSFTYSGRRCRPASPARWTRSMSSMDSCRIRALFSRKNAPTLSGSTWAAWAAASWRDWNSDWVMISPFTLAMIRSRISAPTGAARSRLGRTRRTICRGMVHLCLGQELRHELADPLVRLLAGEEGADAPLGLFEALLVGRLPRLDPEDMIPQGRLHNLAHAPHGEGEGPGLQLRPELAPRQRAPEPALRRLRAPARPPG